MVAGVGLLKSFAKSRKFSGQHKIDRQTSSLMFIVLIIRSTIDDATEGGSSAYHFLKLTN
jgi:hypothetical protein